MPTLVDLDGDGAQELVWRRPDNALHVWKGRMAPGGSRQDWSGLFPAEAPLPRLFDVSQPNLPPPLPTPLRTTSMAVGDTKLHGLPDLVSMDETGVSLSIVRPSTDLGKFAGQAKLLGSVTLENSTAPAWLGDHLVVVQGGNQLVFLDPWSGSPPCSLTGSAINEIATGSQFGKGSILYRRANGTAGTITVDDNGAVAHETWNSIGTIGVDVTRLLPSPRPG